MKLAFMCTLLFLFGTQAPRHLCFASNYPHVNYDRVLHQFIVPSPPYVHAATVRLTMQAFAQRGGHLQCGRNMVQRVLPFLATTRHWT